MEENEITEIIIGCAMKVHSILGPGLLESVYEVCLLHEFERQNFWNVLNKKSLCTSCASWSISGK